MWNLSAAKRRPKFVRMMRATSVKGVPESPAVRTQQVAINEATSGDEPNVQRPV